ncbi:uncharacterized protein LOC127447811 [Myxocyprinus asiaticus]|uniref:uncharacterized protein LOC127447811 n=1 Tax=Myxocyprinus asiaticus TaxID=70543 RepID=UPI002222ADF7|nr:uncharacterized protein LOC127447811 [Myxocyprinus asiaticus]XP_051565851.1 uncharacterized protein LOC127447811 [Myxocyprinus asiaticus]
MGELNEEMPEIQEKLLLQQEQLQDLGKTLQGTILTVNMHSAILNNTLHALDALSKVVRSDITYVRMVRDLMHDLVREISTSVNSLSGGKIPSYLVPLNMVEQILRSATTTIVQTSQIHLAYSLGSAIPIHVNPQNLERGFILKLPIIEKQNIYRLKSILNVGFWKNNVHVHIKTPPVLAYHDDDPSLYLIPNLNMCTNTKDIHWVCPSNPFIRDITDHLCSLRADTPEQKYHASVSLKDEGTESRVERAGSRWLVSTPATEILMSYDCHETNTKLTIPNQTVFLKVPQGATVHIADIVLHHLSPERHDSEIEMMDAFRGHNLTIDDTLQQQLLAEGTKLVKFSLKSTGVTTKFFNRIGKLSAYQEHPISLTALGLLLNGWIIMAVIAYAMHRHIQTLHTRLDAMTLIPQRFKLLSTSLPLTAPNSAQEQLY